MSQYINVGEENSTSIDLYYEDHGSGEPVILIHGWPLNCVSWEKQVSVLLDAGYRVIMYDRRGFGNSSQPTSGYNYVTFASDLDKIIKELDLNNATLIGFAMGGGEVARYLGVYGTERVNKAVFISSITPYMQKTSDNNTGVDDNIFEGFKHYIASDRLAFLNEFFSNFYNLDVLLNDGVSEEDVIFSWNIASRASPKGTLDSVQAWLTDFREDLKNIDIPVLVIHGSQDRIIPLENSGKNMPHFVRDCKLVIIADGPHGINWTHSELVNQELLQFLEE